MLNSKNEFGANNLTELTLKKGNKVIMPGLKRKWEAKEAPEAEKEKKTPKLKKRDIILPRTLPKITLTRKIIPPMSRKQRTWQRKKMKEE